MNWLESIEKAIDYIESHLNDYFSIEDVAAYVYMSSGYFQKAFSMLCGFTVSEYIRNRRLAEAGMGLLSSNEKIIDIALKYGYDSHDSFTKAFSRFHDATPSAVRRGGRTLKAFAPLRLQFILGGGYMMTSVSFTARRVSTIYPVDGGPPILHVTLCVTYFRVRLVEIL